MKMTANPEVLLNLLILIVSLWALMILNHKIIKPTRLNEKRFKLYKLRDDLALMATEGKIKENSDEFMILMQMINSALASTKNFEITYFLAQIGRLVRDKKLQRNVENIITRIEREELPAEYKELVQSFFESARDLFEYKTWLIVHIMTPLIVFFKALGAMIKFCRTFSNSLKLKQEQIQVTDQFYNSNIQRISAI